MLLLCSYLAFYFCIYIFIYHHINVLFFRSEVEGEDVIDSDFSIDENDEVVSDQEDGSGKMQKKSVVTKAYKVETGK